MKLFIYFIYFFYPRGKLLVEMHINTFSLIYVQAILNSISEHLYRIHRISIHIQSEL